MQHETPHKECLPYQHSEPFAAIPVDEQALTTAELLSCLGRAVFWVLVLYAIAFLLT